MKKNKKTNRPAELSCEIHISPRINQYCARFLTEMWFDHFLASQLLDKAESLKGNITRPNLDLKSLSQKIDNSKLSILEVVRKYYAKTKSWESDIIIDNMDSDRVHTSLDYMDKMTPDLLPSHIKNLKKLLIHPTTNPASKAYKNLFPFYLGGILSLEESKIKEYIDKNFDSQDDIEIREKVDLEKNTIYLSLFLNKKENHEKN